MALSLIMIVASLIGTINMDCIRNDYNTILFGDSRTDMRVAIANRDFVGDDIKMRLDGTSSSGPVSMFVHRFHNDEYVFDSDLRIVYAGINDCGLSATHFSLGGALTKQQAFSKIYDAVLNRIVFWKRVEIGTTGTYTHQIGAFASADSPFYNFATASDVKLNPGTSTGLFWICTDGTGSIGGTAFTAGVKCTFVENTVTIVGLLGKLYVSNFLAVKAPTQTKGLLIRSYASTQQCAELVQVWNEQGALDSPNDAGIYPNDGVNANHGSIRVRAFFRLMISDNCEGVNWDAVKGPSCTTCPMKTSDTAQLRADMGNLSSAIGTLGTVVISNNDTVSGRISEMETKEKNQSTEISNLSARLSAEEGKMTGGVSRVEFQTALVKTEMQFGVVNATIKESKDEIMKQIDRMDTTGIIEEANKRLNATIQKVNSVVDEATDQLSTLAIIGIVGLCVAGVSLLLGILLLGAKFHARIHNNGGCCM